MRLSTSVEYTTGQPAASLDPLIPLGLFVSRKAATRWPRRQLRCALRAQTVAATVDAYAGGVERALGGALDPRRLAPAAGGARGAAAVAGAGGAKLGDIVWQRLSKARACIWACRH